VRVETRLDKGSGWSLSGEVPRHEKIPLTEIGKNSEDRFPNSLGTARGSPAAVSVRGLALADKDLAQKYSINVLTSAYI
jgi:hypothetical protein